jgi:hypothetical protein
MTFLVSSRHDGSILAGMDAERLLEVRNAIQDGFDSGLLKESYAFVGGGSIWILEAENEAVVQRLLRSIGVKNAEVSPIVRMLDLIDAHLEHRINISASVNGPKA